MVIRWVCLISLFCTASSISTGGCAKALARCGGVHAGDVVYYEIKNQLTLTVVDVKDRKVLECPNWIFKKVENKEDQALCPVFAYPYLVSLFAYAVMIACGVLMVVGWMATVCTDDSICVFRVALATYWFGDLAAAILASFVVQTYYFDLGEPNFVLSLVCINAYSILAFDMPMTLVQHACYVRRRGLMFVTCAGALGILWSSVAFTMALDPKMGMLYGAHPLVMATFSFLLDMIKKVALRYVWRCLGLESSKQLDMELGFCLRCISSPVPEDNLAPANRSLRRSKWRMLTGHLSRHASRPSTTSAPPPVADVEQGNRGEQEERGEPG